VSEIAHTHAWRVPRGAELVGGPKDGLRVIAAATRIFERSRSRSEVVFLLSDGSQHAVPSSEPVDWLHPERSRS
jgi:hypothetical protein